MNGREGELVRPSCPAGGHTRVIAAARWALSRDHPLPRSIYSSADESAFQRRANCIGHWYQKQVNGGAAVGVCLGPVVRIGSPEQCQQEAATPKPVGRTVPSDTCHRGVVRSRTAERSLCRGGAIWIYRSCRRSTYASASMIHWKRLRPSVLRPYSLRGASLRCYPNGVAQVIGFWLAHYTPCF